MDCEEVGVGRGGTGWGEASPVDDATIRRGLDLAHRLWNRWGLPAALLIRDHTRAFWEGQSHKVTFLNLHTL